MFKSKVISYIIVFLMLVSIFSSFQFGSNNFVQKAYATGENTIYTYDMTSAYNKNIKSNENYDQEIFMTTLQGIVNKKGARLYLYYPNDVVLEYVNPLQTKKTSNEVFNELRKAGQWLSGYTVVNLTTIDDVIDQFKSDITGVVAWDSRVDATCNVATTIAGVEDAPAVMYGSKLYTKLTSSPNNITVKVNLNGQFSGVNAKTDAYNWAKTNYMDNNKVSCKTISILTDGYSRYPDKAYGIEYTAPRDYLVKSGAFVMDLFSWPDEKPNDAPEEPLGSDYNTLISILSTVQNKWGNKFPVEVIGFTPWWLKYCAGSHGPVQTEWNMAQILSTYGAGLSQICDTFGASNASFLSWGPMPARMQPQEAPARKTIANKTYICFYNGDHDGGTMNYAFNSAWNDPRRGQIPIAWGIVPWMIKDYTGLYTELRETATKNDFFWAGGSGATYADPGFIDSTVWQRGNEHFFDRAGYTMTGFVLNGNAGMVTDANENVYRQFSGDGICILGSQMQNVGYTVRNGNLAVASIRTDMDRINVDTQVSTIYNYLNANYSNLGTQPNFIVVRTSFSMPSTLEQTYKKLIADYPSMNFEAVDPYTLFSLIRQKVGGQASYDSTVINTDVPDRMVAGQKYPVKITVRNTGVSAWTTANDYRLGADSSNQFNWSDFQDGGYSNSVTDQRVFLNATDNIQSQQTKTFTFNITAPTTAGTYNFSGKMVRDGYSWFGMSYAKSISVVSATQNEARLVSISAPNEIVQGQSAQVSFTYKNIGTATWTSANNYRLGAVFQNDQDLKAIPNTFIWSSFTNGGYSNYVYDQRAYMSASDSVAPGQTKTFTFNITAPYGRGKFVLSAAMVRDGYSWFGDDAVKDITVVPASRTTNEAKSIMVIVPKYVSVDEKVNVSVCVRNSGTATWDNSTNYKLAATSANQFIFTDMANGGYSNSITDQRVNLSTLDSIKPEESKTYNFSITAPSTTGTYRLSTKMSKDGTGTFGDQFDVDINVTSVPLDASFIEDDIPTTVAAGSEIQANLILRNNGTESLKMSTLCRLAATTNNQFLFKVNAPYDSGYSNSVTDQRYFLKNWANIKQGTEYYGFRLGLVAPTTPGTYTFEVKMIKDGVGWFGQTFTKTITVVSGYSKMINVGGGAVVDENGISWLADQQYTSGSWGYTGTTTTASTTNSISKESEDINIGYYGTTELKTCRKGTSFGYRFDNVPNGTYKIKFLFADLQSTASDQNVSNITAEGYEVFNALDVYKHRMGAGNFKAMALSPITVTVSDTVLNIDLSNVVGNAYVNAMVVERVD